jgi:putative FmdB family regulatory protein
MPLYDYKCSKCGHVFEALQKMSEEPLKYCPVCKGPIKRLISAAGVIFKGSGFYATDSGKKGERAEKGDKAEKTLPKPAEKTESKPAETKKETTPKVAG